MKGVNLRLLAGLAVVSLLAILGLALLRPSSPAARPAAPGLRDASVLPAALVGRPAPEIRLRDDTGATFDTASLAGRPYAVTFLYTSCPDVCPLIGNELRQALIELGPLASKVAVVGVSVDPTGDTPAAVRAWLKVHREPANFHYLIGTAATLTPVWKAYFALPQTPGDPQSSHSATIWLVDGHGRRRALITAGIPVPAGDLAYDLRALL
ncbi:MAG TPA: SCO family protein [Solirubrobacteraceae bacterium]|jgi:protein SCO1/2|nr:SCO family protein [Solirubrobacteraceae bacterium]